MLAQHIDTPICAGMLSIPQHQQLYLAVLPVLQPSMPDVAITVAQAFSLHSRPNATRKILLDFDGHVTTGTAWNAQSRKATITTPPYNKVGASGPDAWPLSPGTH